PALGPGEACQQAIDAGRLVHRAHPLNAETAIPALVGGVVVPNARFYMRNNFAIPHLDAADFRLTVGGLAERPQRLTVRDLQNMRSKTLAVTLECAGNGRGLFDRPSEGEQWGLGAVSTAEWTGVPLVEILDRAGGVVRQPVPLQRVRAVITEPSTDTDVRSGELAIRGVAWSGAAPIARVEVSIGGAWEEARLVGERRPYSWQWWELMTRVEK